MAAAGGHWKAGNFVTAGEGAEQRRIQAEIDALVLPNRLERQYPASRQNLDELRELGLLKYMPTVRHPSARGQVGQTDANRVLAAARQRPGAAFNRYGEGEETGGSALWRALNRRTG